MSPITPSPAPTCCRLKIGVCEGFPNSIMPDENGRADYHGASVNLAARFMSAGAVFGVREEMAWEGGWMGRGVDGKVP